MLLQYTHQPLLCCEPYILIFLILFPDHTST
jgi:hypothetical protein